MPKTQEQTQPKNPNLRNKAYKFRVYPTHKQIGTLEWTLRRCKKLYNAALEERREAYRMSGVRKVKGTIKTCPGCGCELDRDHNAARNVLYLYHKQESDGAGSVPQRSPRGRTVEAPGF
ncbi:MAG: helix-turn-helix domain-containing protein [Ktedonobacteraceae bacterium]|nr:helix-turn-helix domain-containing protein [Ktedonobacteraceae bacterium]